MVLLKLLAEAQARGQRALVFASSLTATHRVARILHLHGNPLKVEGLRTEAVAATGVSEAEAAAHAEKGWTAGEFSRALPQNQRNSMLSKLRAGAVNVLVCSDSAARGLDLPQVDVVINYDAPAHLKTYLHRVGRTARAGKAGTSYTLLRSDQVRSSPPPPLSLPGPRHRLTRTVPPQMGFFKRMLRKADHNTVRRYKTKRMPWHLLAPRVRAALRELRNVLATETRSAMALYAPVEPLPVRQSPRGGRWVPPTPAHACACRRTPAGSMCRKRSRARAWTIGSSSRKRAEGPCLRTP